MTFTSTSKKVLEVKNLNLVYKVPVQRRNQFRDIFTGLFQNPIDTLFPQRDRLHVVRNISFRVSVGERVGILGVNGAGKTSLCRCIAGMFRPQSGEIILHDRVRGIFDTHIGIQPELTGRENAELLAHFMYPEVDDIQKLVEEAAAFSELGSFIDVPYKLYSNGMQARLCLSVVSARPAGLLILDEVFDGADMFFREKVSHRVLELMKSSGAVIFVSHALSQIRRVCTRVLILDGGQIIFDGLPEEAIQVFEKSGQGQARLGHEGQIRI